MGRGKRKEMSTKDKEDMRLCLRSTNCSLRDATFIWNVARSATEADQASLKDFFIEETERCAPARACYKEHKLSCWGADAPPETVWIADLPETLSFLAEESVHWQRALLEATKNKTGIRVVLYCDDAQGGNILSPERKKKLCAVYAALADLPSCLHLDDF